MTRSIHRRPSFDALPEMVGTWSLYSLVPPADGVQCASTAKRQTPKRCNPNGYSIITAIMLCLKALGGDCIRRTAELRHYRQEKKPCSACSREWQGILDRSAGTKGWQDCGSGKGRYGQPWSYSPATIELDCKDPPINGAATVEIFLRCISLRL